MMQKEEQREHLIAMLQENMAGEKEMHQAELCNLERLLGCLERQAQ